MMDAYSVPCAPETNASTGPGLFPRTMTTGIDVAASTPAGISRVPVVFCPGAAVAVPTVKLFCASTVAQQKATRENKHAMQWSFMAGARYSNADKKHQKKI